MMEKLVKDFRHFAKDKCNIDGLRFDDGVKKVSNSLVPYILEERRLNCASMDVFSRLLFDRIIYFSGEVTEESCNIAAAQILYLSSVDERDISLYINSPGGSVVDGLMVIDTMNYIPNDISTICMGMAASMGSVLLSNGTKGKRFVLPHSRVMIHSVSSFFKGHTADMKIEMEQTLRCQSDIYKILAENTGKTFEEIEKLCDRDNWFIGEEAVKELNIADDVLVRKKEEKTD